MVTTAVAAKKRAGRGRAAQESSVRAVVSWYFSSANAFPVTTRARPFYCDPARVGAFAVDPDELAHGDEAALFRLFVTLSMYQALRDVVIMRQQRALSRSAMRVIADANFMKRSVPKHECPALVSGDSFARACTVAKRGASVDCRTLPGARCHVKDATVVLRRMGDMGKLPTSAWLQLWCGGGLGKLLSGVCREEASPTRRAEHLVQRFTEVRRVGRKVATMFVSALSTPGLAPGLTPWFPDVDGNELVVVDTNVARAVNTLCTRAVPSTYEARVLWVREQAACIDLREFCPELPSYSPRLVQEALYAFCSKSNRIARGDECAQRTTPCAGCTPAVCPFAHPKAPACGSTRVASDRGARVR